MRNIVKIDGWEAILNTIKESETNCDKLTGIIDAECQHTWHEQLEASVSEQARKVDELLVHSQAQDKEREKELLAEFRSDRNEQRDLHTTEEEAKCHTVFRTTDYGFDKDKNPKPVLGTRKWFLNHPKYQSWLNDAETNWLWVTANPGC